MNQFGVKINNVASDSTGIGAGLFHMLKGATEFVAGGKATNPIYGNMKDQLYYTFADYINNDMIKISYSGYKDEIVQELQAHTVMDYDKDSKTKILSKDKVRLLIGRSPDLADALVMRMIWQVKSQGFGFSFV